MGMIIVSDKTQKELNEIKSNLKKSEYKVTHDFIIRKALDYWKNGGMKL